jgi:hypothetical protein
LNHRSSHHRRHGRRGLFRQIRHDLRKFYKAITGRSEPKYYRPYLGPSHAGEQTSLETEDLQPTERQRRRQRRKRKSSSTGLWHGSLTDLKRKWEQRKSDRRRKKYHNRARRKHRRENRIKAWDDFIRRFAPDYKKRKAVPFNELSTENVTEQIKQQQKNYFYYTINSTAIFIIAYILVYLVYQLTVLIVASKWRLDSVLLYYDLAFNDYSPLWNRQNIIITTISGPVISLLIGILFYRFFSGRKKVKGFLKLFYLWIAMHGLNLFLGAFSSGVSFDQGFGYVPAWLYWNVFWQIFVSLLFLFLFGYIGYYSATKFLDTSKSAYRVRPENKYRFLLFQVALPMVIGTALMLIVKIPNNMPYETGTLVTMFFGIVPMFLNKKAKPTITFEREKKATHIKWIYIVIFVFLLFVYRIGLNNGLHVRMYYDFIFSLHINAL